MTCNTWATEAYKHATECYPEECCGLVLDIDGTHTYWKCKNISKAYKEPYVNYAAKVMMGKKKLKDIDFNPQKNGYAIKIPVFSFDKFPKVNKELGPEMKSTGEAIRFIKDLKDPFFRKIYSERNLYLSK